MVAGGGRTLMPGLIDNHWHTMLARTTPAQAFGDVGYNNLQAADEATDTLMRGFTTVRDRRRPRIWSQAGDRRRHSSRARASIRPAP